MKPMDTSKENLNNDAGAQRVTVPTIDFEIQIVRVLCPTWRQVTIILEN